MKPVTSWIHHGKTMLSHLTQHINRLNQLTLHLHNCLPPEWSHYCQVVRYDTTQKILVISTTEQNLVTSLRYLQTQLLAQLKKISPEFHAIEKINCVYSPAVLNTQKTRLAPKSNDAANTCLLAAEHCPPALKKSLENLSKTLSGIGES